MKSHRNYSSTLSKFILTLVYGLSLTTLAQAGEIKIGNLQFSDAEWSVTQTKETVSMLTNGSKGVVLVNAPTKYAGDKKAAFRSFLKTIDFILGKTRYRNIQPVSDFRLNGDYRLLRADSVTGVENQVSSGYVETNYGFTQDGRFIKGGSISMFSSFGSSSVLTSGNRHVQAGHYKIEGYTLTLSFDDGKTQKKAFFLMDGVPVINGDLYEKLN